MSDKDITERLRRCGCCDSCEAADEIERLRAERSNLRMEIDRMVDKLTAQRDAARREACRWMAEAEGGTPVKYSAEMGWFCFGEKP